jgi:hypothetical protein
MIVLSFDGSESPSSFQLLRFGPCQSLIDRYYLLTRHSLQRSVPYVGTVVNGALCKFEIGLMTNDDQES